MNTKPKHDTGVYGLRTVRNYKLYRKAGAYYASLKTGNRIRRITLQNRATAEAVAAYPESQFCEHINQLLDAAKRCGSINYYEGGQ